MVRLFRAFGNLNNGALNGGLSYCNSNNTLSNRNWNGVSRLYVIKLMKLCIINRDYMVMQSSLRRKLILEIARVVGTSREPRVMYHRKLVQILKRYCKHIDITDYKTIIPFVKDCIYRHYKRYDFRQLLIQYGLTKKQYRYVVEKHDKTPLNNAIEKIARAAAQMIYERDIQGLKPTRITKKYDKTSGKIREIGWECALQQVFDFIAVYGAMELLSKRIVKQQASSMMGRGQIYGLKMIKKWVNKSKSKSNKEYSKRHHVRPNNELNYFVKLDVKKCFPSMRRRSFMIIFSKECANMDLVWLWDYLLRTHCHKDYKGFMIGSLLSQWAVQYCMSFVYRFVMSEYGIIRGVKCKRISHALIFMDDILLIGSRRPDLLWTSRLVSQFVRLLFEMRIKKTFCITKYLCHNPIDMLGFRVYSSGRVSIRPRNFIHIRRLGLRNSANVFIPMNFACRAISYGGFVKYSNSIKANKRYHIMKMMNKSRRIISIYSIKERSAA